MTGSILANDICANTLRGVTVLNLQASVPAGPVENDAETLLHGYINRIVDQDQAALSALFKAVSARVYSTAVRITGNVQLAEEVVEDVFFQIWRQAPRFDPARGTALAWILTIARSRALDARRRIPPFTELTGNEAENSPDSQEKEGLPDLLSVIEQNQCLHAALASLDTLPRQLLALAYFRGLSHEEIADYTQLPLGTVKSHLRRSLGRLREMLCVND